MNKDKIPTCHWCHVMERESFEDNEVAEILNKHFVSIKVDREERPDIDSVYMRVCQMMTGGGGWPLSIVMDTDRKPFFAGTYFPKTSFGRHIGFIDLLLQLLELWEKGRAQLHGFQDQIMNALNASENRRNKEISAKAPENAVGVLLRSFDSVYGGFGGAPKFPSPHNLMFLLRAYCEYGDERLKDAALKTLESMYSGGIYDHIGYGFCRYSTDKRWLVPHFEKMLYDNALLAIAYTEAFLVSGEERHKKTAEEILTYVLRDMTSPEGGFYSAEDADSEGVEGKFYLWSKSEVEGVLGKADGERFCRIYGITEGGNFEGANIPNLIDRPLSAADAEFAKNCAEKLFAAREKRIHPSKDMKILASWNGLMIAAFATAGRVFGEKRYTDAAEKAMAFVSEKLSDGYELYTRYSGGETLKKQFADDYAFIIWGLIELYQTTLNPEYLNKAIGFSDGLIEKFYDESSSGVFLYPKSAGNILMRPKEIYDGAMPSSNSVTAYNLIRLSRLTGNAGYEQTAVEILNYFAEEIESRPYAYTFSLISLMYVNGKSSEIVITARDAALAKEPLSLIDGVFMPFTTKILVTNGTRAEIEQAAPFTVDYPIGEKEWTAYVCRDNTCLPGISDIEKLKKELK